MVSSPAESLFHKNGFSSKSLSKNVMYNNLFSDSTHIHNSEWMVNYWLDLFTGTTWKEFQDAGAQISGFRERRRRTVDKITQGDILLCYMTGVMRWVGAIEVVGPSDNKDKIWKAGKNSQELAFPARLRVKPLIILQPEYGVPMEKLKGKVEFFQDDSDRQGYKGFLRQSPLPFSSKDGEYVYSIIRDAKENPISKPVDTTKLNRTPLYKIKEGSRIVTVTVPEKEEDKIDIITPIVGEEESSSIHTEIQYYLLKLGSDMGLNLWVASNDRSKKFNNQVLGDMPHIITVLPTQFNEATQKTIELIDVLWLKANSIVAAFEVEATTSIYSGLLRMSDLLALQPNLEIKLYLVAHEEKYDKVKREILRPTFEKREKPLSRVCGYITFSELTKKIKGIQDLGIGSHLKPEFLEDIAEYFEAEED